MSDRKTRVLVVEDSLTVRRMLIEELAADPDVVVVGEAGDGRRGAELCAELRPDVVTMDMMMPVANGLSATEHIMAYCPTPILVVSASVNRGEAFRTFDALAAGAVDVLDKPSGREPAAAWGGRLRSAVKMAARIRVIRHPRARLSTHGATPQHHHAARALPPRDDRARRVVAIGGSTGAPAAAMEILKALPRNYPLPIVLVIHISPTFAPMLAEWLGVEARLDVRVARDGEPIGAAGPGSVRMAPPDRHLVVEGDVLRVSDAPERHSCRPSVDVLFESVARTIGSGAVGCLLTGMGVDGAAGLLAIRRAGGRTIAQDERTSQIYGMPAEAKRRGAAEEILPLPEIAGALGAAGAGAARVANEGAR